MRAYNNHTFKDIAGQRNLQKVENFGVYRGSAGNNQFDIAAKHSLNLTQLSRPDEESIFVSSVPFGTRCDPIADE